jgi:hypothetical protein
MAIPSAKSVEILDRRGNEPDGAQARYYEAEKACKESSPVTCCDEDESGHGYCRAQPKASHE